MSLESEQDEQLLISQSDDELQSLGSQSDGDGQDEGDSGSDLGDLEEDSDDSEDDENAELVIDEAQSSNEEVSSDDDNEEIEFDDHNKEVGSENDEEMESDDEDENQVSERNSDKDSDGKKKIPNDLRLKVLKKIKSRYEHLEGKTLYVRFPYRLPEDTAEVLKTLKDFCSRVSKVRRMRQKYARYCLVDFESREDREKGLKELGKAVIEGKKLFVSYPRCEQPGFIEKVTEKRLNKITQRTIKAKLTKLVKNKNKLNEKVFTSTIIVKNIPPSAQLSDIKQLFPKAVDVKVKMFKDKEQPSIATVTMPTPQAASDLKKQKLKMNDNILQTYFQKPESFSAKERNDSVASQSPKKRKRMLDETISEFSTIPKMSKKATNKPVNLNKKLNNVQGKKLNKDGTNKDPTSQNQNLQQKIKNPNFKQQNESPNPKQANLSLNQQKKQKNAVKNGSSETVEQIVRPDDALKKQELDKEQKNKQSQKPRFPIMKKNFQGKGVKSGEVF